MNKPLLLFFIIFCVDGLHAQNRKDTSTNRQIEIVDLYKPRFMDVQKIESVPVIEKSPVSPPVFSYQIRSHQVQTEKIIKPIPMTDMAAQQTTVYPSSFVKLGYGNIRTPLAEIYLNNKQNQKYSYGVHYRFLQSNSDLNRSFADFTNHNFKGYASTFTKAGEVGLDVHYKYDRYYFYGFNDSAYIKDTTSELPGRTDLARTVRTFDASAFFNSTHTSPKKARHRTRFNFYHFGIGKAVETQYALSSKIYGRVPDLENLTKGQLSATIGFDYNIFKNDTLESLKRFFIQVDPRYEFVYEGMKISAGFNTTVFFSGKDTSETFFNPVIRLEYPIMEDIASIYAGIDGRYRKQTLRNLIGINPYLNRYELVNQVENAISYLGVQAKMSPSADAVFEIGYSDISFIPLFVSNDTSFDRLNSFAVKYKQVSLLKFTTAFNYSFSEKVRIGLLGNFYNYEVMEEPYPWQLPNMDGKLNMRFNIRNKIYPHLDILAMGVQKQRTGTGTQYSVNSIDAFYDLSAGIDFRFKSKLSAFVQANNMLGSRYQRWYNYPVYGFNIIGGITMIF